MESASDVIDSNLYPNVAMWKENMKRHDQENLIRIRTPAATGNSSAISNNNKSPITLDNNNKSPRVVSSLTRRLNSPMKSRGDALPKTLFYD